MPQFFITMPSGEKGCVIEGKDYEHLVKVRRVREGDEITLRNCDGSLLRGRVVEIFDSSMAVEILDRREPSGRAYSFTLGIGILKGWKFDLVIQKAVEIGVTRLVPVITERAVPHIEGKEEKKLIRWNKIAVEAAKQCMRRDVPEISAPCSFEEFIAMTDSGEKFIAHPHENAQELKMLLRGTVRSNVFALMIGPEGGFSENEVNAAVSKGWKAFRAGNNCMRAETAAIVLPAIFMYEWSEYV